MNFSRIFIERPIMTTLVMIGILIFGIVGYFELPVSDLPSVDYPTIQVSASLPGANPDTMAASVATPLEQQFTTIAGLDSMTSSSALGSTQITLQFNLNRNIDGAAQDVQTAISTALQSLPPGMPTPPSLRKVNPADSPILFLAVGSDIAPLYTVDEYAENILAQEVSMVSGVAQVSVFGSQKYAVRVQYDPKSLAARGIGVNEITQAVQNGNVNLPTGALYGNNVTWTLQTNGQLMHAKAYQPLVVSYQDGAPVHLRDVAQAVDSVQNTLTASWLNNHRSIILAIFRQPGTNTIEIINRIKHLLPAFQSILPPSIHLSVMFDRSLAIRRSVNDVQSTLLLTIFLVIVVIFLFLRSFFATLISSLALPMSIMGTFAVMAILHYSLDNMSLMALTLCVGFVVDDAIVMLENITRHMEMGKTPLQASLDGSAEIGFTIVSMTISLVAVFIPLIFMGGFLGRLFNEFAVTIAVAILVSGFVSITLTPMLCSRFLKPQDLGKTNIILAILERGFQLLTAFYHWSLKKTLRHPVFIMIVYFLLFAATIATFLIVPKGFIPTDDIDQISGTTEGLQGLSFPEMSRHQNKLARIIEKDPNVVSVMSTVGTNTDNTGRLFIGLKPGNQRKLNSDQVIQELRPKLSHIPGMKIYLTSPPSIRIGGHSTKGNYQFTLQCPDLPTLYKSVDSLAKKIRTIPGVQDANTDLLLKNPQLNIYIDRQKAAAYGVSARQLETVLSDAYGTQQISSIYSAINTYEVISELKPRYQGDLNTLGLLYIRSLNGILVPLKAIAKVTQTVGPLTVNHLGQYASGTISFNLKPGAPLGGIVSEIKQMAKETLPQNVTSTFEGSAKTFESSLQDLPMLLLLAILVIYLVLGILYESFIHPVTILSGLIPALLGALMILSLYYLWQPSDNTQLNIYGYLGLIMLVGIVKKNAIMMIDFAVERERSENLTPQDAIYEACVERFRPIMMTTLAALMGTLPIAIHSSTRQSLGLAVFGGLLVSQFLTLYITPVIYIYLDQFSHLWSKKPANRNLGNANNA